jgi:MFS family permease
MAVMRRAMATRFALPPASLDKQQKLIVLFLQGSVSRWMALIALAFMWTGAQAPLYLFGEPSNLHFSLAFGGDLVSQCFDVTDTEYLSAGAPVYIYRDLGGVNYWVWFITANLLATAAISPFVGALSDLMGRRSVAIVGSTTILIGQAICGAANGMGMFIGEFILPHRPTAPLLK